MDIIVITMYIIKGDTLPDSIASLEIITTAIEFDPETLTLQSDD